MVRSAGPSVSEPEHELPAPPTSTDILASVERVEQQIEGINEELSKLKTDAERLKKEIAELSGDEASVIG